MSALAPNRPVATLDEFLADPLVLDEFAAVLASLSEDGSPFRDALQATIRPHREFTSLRIKGRYMSAAKRTRLNDDDAARLILDAWRDRRP